jgi:hypothetical protein
MKMVVNSQVPKGAGIQLVFIDGPASGDGIPLEFCATGTADATVGAVTVDLTDAKGNHVDGGSVRVAGGFWAFPLTLSSNDPNAFYNLTAYNAAPGDGGTCVKLHYDETVMDDDCREVKGGKDDPLNAEKLAGYVGPFAVTYPEPKPARDISYEAIVAERITPPNNRFHYEPEFTVDPPKTRSVYLPNVGPGLYVVRFVYFTERGQVRTYSKAKQVPPA